MSTPGHFRALARRALGLPLKVATSGSEVSLEARLLDVGLGGAQLELPVPVEPGDRLKLFLDLPLLWDPLAIEAVVAWSVASSAAEPPRAGVRFDAVPGKALRQLAELIASP